MPTDRQDEADNLFSKFCETRLKVFDSFNRKMLRFLRDKKVRTKRWMDIREYVHLFVIHP